MKRHDQFQNKPQEGRSQLSPSSCVSSPRGTLSRHRCLDAHVSPQWRRELLAPSKAPSATEETELGRGCWEVVSKLIKTERRVSCNHLLKVFADYDLHH